MKPLPRAALLTLILLALPRLFPPGGPATGGFAQLLGRFHPVSIHLPIALLLIIPVLELAGRTRSALREAAALMLPAALLCCFTSVLLGLLLAHSGGFAPDTVLGHMWWAIVLTLLVLTCTLLRSAWQAGGPAWPYSATLAAAVLLTFWTGHLGGSITYGKGYLTELLPSLLPKPRRSYPPVDPASAYATEVQPILNSKCVSCHGPAKQKGGLQLDTYAHVMDGRTSGPVVIENHPESSILIRRVTLPPTDRKFMPSEGKPPLTPAEIATIQTWIRKGASPLTQ